MTSLSPKEIKRTVEQIREQSIAGIPDHKIRYTFRDFHKKLPHLFDAALNTAFDLKYLDMMLKQMSVAQKAKSSKEKEQIFDKADETIIGALREEYLDPLIANAPRAEEPQEPVIQVVKDGGAQVSIHTT